MVIDNLVLGAGISGLAYADAKKGSGENTVIFEANDYYGGLCHSFNVNGYTFDSAVHLSFTNNQEVRDVFDQTDYYAHQPIAYNYYHGAWLKHPVLNNLYPLSVKEKVTCITSFMERDHITDIRSYRDWLLASYGLEFTDRFYEKYTKKYWTVNSDQMSTTWLGNRLNTPDITKMLTGAMDEDTGNDYYAKEMRYPKGNKGYQTFLDPLIKDVNIEYKKKAVRINSKDKTVWFQDGTSYQYKNLISSIPMPELIRIMDEVPEDIKENAKELKASKISIVSVGFNKENIPPYLWMYIYDEDILAARINSPSLKSKDNVPKGCSSMQFEIYHNPDAEIDHEEIVQNVKNSLLKMKLCKEEDIAFMDYRLLPYGNVIFLKDMEQHRKAVKDYISKTGIQLIGRFGEWEYYWSDQSYMSGKNRANSGQ